MKYKIRRATNKDIPEIKNLIFGVLQEYGLVPDEEGQDSSLSNIEANYFGKGGYFAVLVSFENEIVGTISVVRAAKGEFELRKMFLKKELRGKGLGKLMMNFILQYAKSNQCKKVTLDTINVLHEAIGLYKSYGFKPVKPKIINDRIDQTYELKL
ncbi:MAG: GNAT family N-acetyltransferase [Saprospiraceae bacterium]|nr:GNAT family N-acetyltransferase [Saprospiraceae bacterium]